MRTSPYGRQYRDMAHRDTKCMKKHARQEEYLEIQEGYEDYIREEKEAVLLSKYKLDNMEERHLSWNERVKLAKEIEAIAGKYVAVYYPNDIIFKGGFNTQEEVNTWLETKLCKSCKEDLEKGVTYYGEELKSVWGTNCGGEWEIMTVKEFKEYWTCP